MHILHLRHLETTYLKWCLMVLGWKPLISRYKTLYLN
nr:MAG TPA: hypothetical protein [Caudoviricetes sp.]